MRQPYVKKRTLAALIAIAALLICLGATWQYLTQSARAEERMLQTAEVVASEANAVWDFMNLNQNQFRTNEDGKYVMYCVVAAKSITRMFTDSNEAGYTIHYTNEHTRRAFDAPDSYELGAVRALKQNTSLESVYSLEPGENGELLFRYVEAIEASESCLECHGAPADELDPMGYPKEGLAVGDIAGVTSITMPATPYLRDVVWNVAVATFIMTLVIACILVLVIVTLRNTQMKRENQQQSAFLSTVSHELRTPLTSILALADILERDEGANNADGSRYLKSLRYNSAVLLSMVNNVLELARADAGRSELEYEIVDPSDLLCSVRTGSLILADRRNITVETRLKGEIPVFMADGNKLLRILDNLVTNAIKFSESDGVVLVILSLSKESNLLIMEVHDQGCGIASDEIDRVFDRFSQTKRSSDIRGTGIGLAVVAEFARLHGGGVEVDSILGRGSTFTVHVKVKPLDQV